ncbi:MAG TPA: ABC transporter permease [Spirochaetia bacterium]|nr:ABC transporter permease [Spirochaetia bacterium]
MSETVLAARRAGGATRWMGRNWALLFLLIELAAFILLGRNFQSLENIQNIFVACLPVLLLGMGETFVIITGGIDLSVGFVMGFGAVICAKFMVLLQAAGLPPSASIPLAALICLVVGLVPGFVNGVLVARLKVPAFLATFGMYGIAYGVSEIVSSNTPISGLPAEAGFIGNEYFLYIIPRKLVTFIKPDHLGPEDLKVMLSIFPIIVIIAAVFVAIFAFILRRTRFGQHNYAIGGSQDAAVRAGINVPRHLTWVYVISAFFASLSGVMYALKYVTGRADAGSARMLDSVVAVVIGGASLYGGTGTVKGTIIGALIIATLETGMVNLGVPYHFRYIAIGLILVLAVLIDQFFPELVGRGE